ncbi:MAG: Flp family type IVb pilin [Frankiaceae bacterium]
MRTGAPGLRSFHPIARSITRTKRKHMSQHVVDQPVDSGATAVEYGLILSAIAALIVAVVVGLGGLAKDQFTTTSDCIAAGVASTC